MDFDERILQGGIGSGGLNVHAIPVNGDGLYFMSAHKCFEVVLHFFWNRPGGGKFVCKKAIKLGKHVCDSNMRTYGAVVRFRRGGPVGRSANDRVCRRSRGNVRQIHRTFVENDSFVK